MQSAEIIVIGAGVAGLAVTASLKQQGAAVLCLEAEPGAGQVESVGETRVFRHLHDDQDLIDLAREARLAWREWERLSGVELLGQEGQLIQSNRSAAAIDTLREHMIDARLLDGEEAHEVFGLLNWRSRGPFAFDPRAGAIRARRVIRVLESWSGDALVTDCRVEEVAEGVGGFTLRSADGEQFSCSRLLIAAGAANTELASQVGIHVAQEERLGLQLTFGVQNPALQPCWSDDTERYGERVYGAPVGPNGYALALAHLGETATPEAAERRLARYASIALPGLDVSRRQRVLRPRVALEGASGESFELYESNSGAACLTGANLFQFAPLIGEQVASELTR